MSRFYGVSASRASKAALPFTGGGNRCVRRPRSPDESRESVPEVGRPVDVTAELTSILAQAGACPGIRPRPGCSRTHPGRNAGRPMDACRTEYRDCRERDRTGGRSFPGPELANAGATPGLPKA